MIDTTSLEEIGFTKGEARVYFSLLELGESTIGPLSKKANVTPSKTYPIMEKLSKKGLITQVIKSDTTYFQSFNPKRILDYLSEKQNKLKADKEKIKEIIPYLISKQKQEAEQSTTLYEGYNGLKTLYNEMTDYLKRTNEDFIAFTLGEEYADDSLMRFFEHYDLIRKELGIKTKLLGLESQRKFFTKEYQKKTGLEIKYLPYKSVPQGVIIFNDKVATMVWGKNPAAFVIQSKKIAESYRNFFQDMWKQAKH